MAGRRVPITFGQAAKTSIGATPLQGQVHGWAQAPRGFLLCSTCWPLRQIPPLLGQGRTTPFCTPVGSGRAISAAIATGLQQARGLLLDDLPGRLHMLGPRGRAANRHAQHVPPIERCVHQEGLPRAVHCLQQRGALLIRGPPQTEAGQPKAGGGPRGHLEPVVGCQELFEALLQAQPAGGGGGGRPSHNAAEQRAVGQQSRCGGLAWGLWIRPCQEQATLLTRMQCRCPPSWVALTCSGGRLAGPRCQTCAAQTRASGS